MKDGLQAINLRHITLLKLYCDIKFIYSLILYIALIIQNYIAMI